ncbi:MAG: LamB/YcsF family protein [bacterium]|nr:LamB/YcsF family protein [Candidatus Kapabacteria bacterium]
MKDKRKIDLNADVGEVEGPLAVANDAKIMRAVTTVNIACGLHAGDASTMRRAVEAAMEYGVSIGAHVSLDDREGFGRREMDVTRLQVYGLVIDQIARLDAIVDAAGGVMTHVKPHGALYHMAARTPAIADAIADAVFDTDMLLSLIGPPGSEILRAGDDYALDIVAEVFADRRYATDGSLMPRTDPNAMIASADHAAKRVITMIDGMLPEDEAPGIAVVAETVCLHSDSPGAAAFAVALRMLLEDAGVIVRSRV